MKTKDMTNGMEVEVRAKLNRRGDARTYRATIVEANVEHLPGYVTVEIHPDERTHTTKLTVWRTAVIRPWADKVAADAAREARDRADREAREARDRARLDRVTFEYGGAILRVKANIVDRFGGAIEARATWDDKPALTVYLPRVFFAVMAKNAATADDPDGGYAAAAARITDMALSPSGMAETLYRVWVLDEIPGPDGWGNRGVTFEGAAEVWAALDLLDKLAPSRFAAYDTEAVA